MAHELADIPGVELNPGDIETNIVRWTINKKSLKPSLINKKTRDTDYI